MTGLVIRNVRPMAGPATDIVVRDGRITALGAGAETGDAEVYDAGGAIALPGLVDAHAHVDKTTWGLPYRPHTAGPTLRDLTENERRVRGRLGATVTVRAGALLGEYVRNGTSYLRSHVDVDTDAGLSSVEGVVAARERFAGQVDVEIVAFPQSGLLVRPSTASLLEAAVSAGADLVGGIDPAGFDGDPVRHLDTVFGIAERTGCGIDIHLHDRGELGAWQLDRIAERTQALGLAGRVTVSHAFALATVPPDRQAELIDALAAADIAVTTVAPGRGDMLPVLAMRSAGIRLGLGQDGVRDLWSPYGDADMISRAWQLAFRCGFRRDDHVEEALRCATTGGAEVLGLTGYGLDIGCHADLLVVPGDTLTDVVMRKPPRALVVKRGRVVVRDGQRVWP